ncbi:MAG: hypothetical protein ACLQVI_27505 [Polyangiaceae bacterium]
MAYRSERDPLKATETALASELASLRRRERDVSRALDDTRAQLRNQRTLPMLEDVRIASPCAASWDDMTGDARVRFCGRCAKNVYNLSEMTREEAETLLAKSEASTNAKMCVRLYKRADGTVLTADCPVGVKRKRVRRVVAAAAMTLGAGGLATMAAGMAMMGEPARPMQGAVATSPAPTVQAGQAVQTGHAVQTGQTATPVPTK